jgi:hypothetical protein
MRVTTRLSPILLEDTEGPSVRLGSFWEDRAIVLVYNPHFG